MINVLNASNLNAITGNFSIKPNHILFTKEFIKRV